MLSRPVTSDPGSSLRLVEVFRSPRLADCDPHTLVLSAVGIHSWTLMRDGDYVIFVTEDTLEPALKHLHEAAREAMHVPPPPRPRLARQAGPAGGGTRGETAAHARRH